MHHLRTLIAAACLASLGSANAQNVPCPGEPLIFQLEGEYHGIKTWEYSINGVDWSAVEVVENAPFILQPEQSGWYRVRFDDEACGINYYSEPQRFVAPVIDLGETLTITIVGVVKDEFGGAVRGATVRAGCGSGVSAGTDPYGVFILEGVVVRENLAVVSVEKEGYFSASRSFLPGESAAEGISYTYMTLLRKNLAGTVSGTSGGQVVGEGVAIDFPTNGFQQDGQPYTGTINVYINHIDPTSEDFHTQMPGMLMGLMDGESRLMLSYGMIGVEISDAQGQTVQLASGSSATVRIPVMLTQQSDAPPTIPLWWFDEDLGYWVMEGEAQLDGNEYVGQVEHFSWWNCDVPVDFVFLEGVLSEDASGTELSNAEVRLISTSMGEGAVYTNALGQFSGMVPIDEVLTLQILLPCGPLGEYVQMHEEEVGPFSTTSSITVLIDGQDLNLISGSVLDCSGGLVQDGYVLANGQPVFCSEGVFELHTCLDSITLRGVDHTTAMVSDQVTIQVTADTTVVDDLVTCTPLFGTVTDIVGNVYLTVLIGTQEWMAENLRTTRYRNGLNIPNITDDFGWSQASIGAWSSFANDPANDATYGKLYNWLAVDYNSNLCPQGWHVPSDDEWNALVGYLDPDYNPEGFTPQSTIAGGKMKATGTLYWTAPNSGATNESGFSGLPGGVRGINGAFVNIGQDAWWWCATEDTPTRSWTRFLYYGGAQVDRASFSKRYGCSVRCVRD
jgi:uncharacterized protein (TIGR02145 family)